MHARLLFSLLSLSVLSGGCIIVDHSNPPTCPIPTQAAYQGLYPQYNVLANASTSLGAGDIGFLLTTNGMLDYRLAFVDTINSPACFTGIVRSKNNVISVSNPGGRFIFPDVATGNGEVRFALEPGASVAGLDFAVGQSPIYLDLFIDGSAVGTQILYTDAGSGLQGQETPPAAFQ